MAKFKWTVVFEVDELWVEDGFNMTDERALNMLASDLNYACMDTELSAKVIKAPSMDKILKMQGYTPETMTDEAKKHELGL